MELRVRGKVTFFITSLSPQDFHSLATYLSQNTSSVFLDIISDFHLLLFLVTNEVMPLRVRNGRERPCQRLQPCPRCPPESPGVPWCSEDTATAPDTAPGRAPAARQDVQLAQCLFFPAALSAESSRSESEAPGWPESSPSTTRSSEGAAAARMATACTEPTWPRLRELETFRKIIIITKSQNQKSLL